MALTLEEKVAQEAFAKQLGQLIHDSEYEAGIIILQNKGHCSLCIQIKPPQAKNLVKIIRSAEGTIKNLMDQIGLEPKENMMTQFKYEEYDNNKKKD